MLGADPTTVSFQNAASGHRYGRIVSNNRARPASQQRYDLAGLSVVERPGDTDLPTLVIVHGGMDRASSFGRLVNALPGVSVLRYDRRGYGRSQPGESVSLEQHTADLWTVIGERERLLIFGHSIGGTIALTALADPSRTTPLNHGAGPRPRPGVLGVLVYESPVPWLSGQPLAPRVFNGTNVEDFEDPADLAEAFMVTMIGKNIWQRLPGSTRTARRNEGPALLGDLAIANGTPRFDPRDVTVPTLVATGSMSVGRRREAEALSDLLARSELAVVPGADHGIHLSDPTAAAGLIRQLMRMSTEPVEQQSN